MHASHSTSAQPTRADTLRVSLFAGMAAAIGRRSLEMAWDGGTAASLRSRLAADFPAIAPLLARSAVAIGDGYVTDDARVPCGADVAIIPPVSGG
jgi:MoaE-MoaD fusion protein